MAKNYVPSPWVTTTAVSDPAAHYRKLYSGQSAYLDDRPAKIMPIEGGRAAAVIGPAQSGEASWFTVNEVMTKRGGKFKLSRGHLAI